MGPGESGRIPGLDGLRAIAVVMVVWHNYGPLPGFARFGSVASLRAGYVGVTLFFVLSGFLISHLLLVEWERTGTVRLAAFYVRRAYRLFPALAVALVMLVGLDAWRGRPWHDTAVALGSAVAYVFNFVASRSRPTSPLGGAGWGHLWSLSVEEQFYVVFPLPFIAAVRRFGARRSCAALVVAATVVTVWRTVLWRHGASFDRLYLVTDMRIDALLLGAALALAVRFVPTHRAIAVRCRWLLVPGLLALLVLAHRGSPATTTAPPGWLLGPGMAVASIAGAVVVWLVAEGVGGRVQALLSGRVATAVGRRSYGIYLFHFPVLAMVGDRSGGWFLSLGLLAIVTELSLRFVEEPMLRRLPGWARPIRAT